ncbi:DNA-binding protein [Coxiella burnetii]|nr:hypothetical protein [Coxiella burnetii]
MTVTGFSHMLSGDKKLHLNRQNLYRVLSKSCNPRLDTLSNIIHALMCRYKPKPFAKIINVSNEVFYPEGNGKT